MRQRNMSRQFRTHSQGFSLIELMLAMALGLVVVLGAVGLFVANQRTFQLQQGLTNVQQQGGFTQGFVMNDLRQAGYQNPSVSSAIPSGVMFATSTNPTVTVNGQKIPLSTDGGSGGNDRLTFSFDGTQDCEGTINGLPATPTPTRIVETYFVSQGNLYCHGSLTAGSGTMLLSGVPSFQVLYGMDTVTDQTATVSSYVTATVAAAMPLNAIVAPNTVGYPPQVVAVRIAYIVQQASGNPQSISSGHTYMLLEQQLQDGTAPLDAANQVRREFVATIPIRNFNWMNI